MKESDTSFAVHSLGVSSMLSSPSPLPGASRRKRRRRRKLTCKDFESVIHLTQQQAAAVLDICLSSLKRQFYAVYGPEHSWRAMRKSFRIQEGMSRSASTSPRGSDSMMDDPHDFSSLALSPFADSSLTTSMVTTTLSPLQKLKSIVSEPQELDLPTSVPDLVMTDHLDYDTFLDTQEPLLMSKALVEEDGQVRLALSQEEEQAMRSCARPKVPEKSFYFLLDRYFNILEHPPLFRMMFRKALAANKTPLFQSTTRHGHLKLKKLNFAKAFMRMDLYDPLFYAAISHFWAISPSNLKTFEFTDVYVEGSTKRYVRVTLIRVGSAGFHGIVQPMKKHMDTVLVNNQPIARNIVDDETCNHITLMKMLRRVVLSV